MKGFKGLTTFQTFPKISFWFLRVKYYSRALKIQATTGLADTVLAETTGLADKLSKKPTILEEKMALFTGFEVMTALED